MKAEGQAHAWPSRRGARLAREQLHRRSEGSLWKRGQHRKIFAINTGHAARKARYQLSQGTPADTARPRGGRRAGLALLSGDCLGALRVTGARYVRRCEPRSASARAKRIRTRRAGAQTLSWYRSRPISGRRAPKISQAQPSSNGLEFRSTTTATRCAPACRWPCEDPCGM